MANEFSLVRTVDEKKNDLWLNKSPIVNIDKEQYFKRALVEINTNEQLSKIAKTKEGIISILNELHKAIGMGLQIGNQIPQAYLLPHGNSVSLSPTAEGLEYIATTAPDPTDENSIPILQSITILPIYEGDDINCPAFSEIEYTPKITADKRNLIGVVGRIIQSDGSFNNKFISRGDIEEIRDKWSKLPNGKAWKNSFDQMARAKAAKRFLKEYAARSEALRNAIYSDEEIEQDPDINNRMGNRLNNISKETEPGPGPGPDIDISIDDITIEESSENINEDEKLNIFGDDDN